MQSFEELLLRQRKMIEAAEDNLRKLKSREREIVGHLIDEYQSTQTNRRNVTIDGQQYTFYRRRTVKASVRVGDQPQLVEICKRMGLDDMIKTEVPTAKVKAYMTELAKGEDEADAFDWDAVPEEMRQLVSIYEDMTVAVRKG